MAKEPTENVTVKGGEAEIRAGAVYRRTSQRYEVGVPKAVAPNGIMTDVPSAKPDFSELTHLQDVRERARTEIGHIMNWLGQRGQELAAVYGDPSHPYSAGFAPIVEAAAGFSKLISHTEERLGHLNEKLGATAQIVVAQNESARSQDALDWLKADHSEHFTPNAPRGNGGGRGR